MPPPQQPLKADPLPRHGRPHPVLPPRLPTPHPAEPLRRLPWPAAELPRAPAWPAAHMFTRAGKVSCSGLSHGVIRILMSFQATTTQHAQWAYHTHPRSMCQRQAGSTCSSSITRGRSSAAAPARSSAAASSFCTAAVRCSASDAPSSAAASCAQIGHVKSLMRHACRSRPQSAGPDGGSMCDSCRDICIIPSHVRRLHGEGPAAKEATAA